MDFTSEDISNENRQLIDYLETLRLKIKKTPIKKKKDKDKITQKELDDLSIKKDLFTQDLNSEYDRLFSLLTRLIKKRFRLKGLRDSWLENNQIIRRNFLFLSLGFLIFVIAGAGDSLISPGVTLVFIRIAMVSSSWMLYIGFKK
ncbi:hypothetical protein LCGC14_0563680 [marine sediment metagenome]|uniref:Uncharacterized protein n=1 Tax=marine sediment metagenome TaxID=412755 RepID=A0A0F9S4W8_9ZZZZ|nr:MAG: hypothetical protein Lokiarch_04430 [Candidatus Lokiarchaeum sp. GC14_75]